MTLREMFRDRADQPDSPYAWLRLAIAVVIGTIGGVGMWSVPVALPAVQMDFGVDRASASLPYTLTMVGFAVSGVFLGRLVDRFGVATPLALGAAAIGLGYVAASFAPNIIVYAIIQGVLVGGGSAAFFGPMMTDISHWFVRRRGIAVAICASGNYVAGAIWPKPLEYAIATSGWRMTHIVVGLICLATLVPAALLMRRKPPAHALGQAPVAGFKPRDLGISPNALTGILCLAGVACCVAMAMPQVHIVAYCGDLGYGVARGAEMLSLMLGLGLIARVLSGTIADRIGGLAALLIGSVMQAFALLLYLGFNGLTSLYVVSAIFGLFQGGIIPMYAVIVREYFSPQEAGIRVGVALMFALFGMALGGWMSGAIFDLTGSYQAAFANGFLWNLLNIAIVGWLLIRSRTWTAGRLATA